MAASIYRGIRNNTSDPLNIIILFYSSQKDTSDEQIKELAQAYKESIAKELHGICGEVLVSLNRKTAILCCCAFQQIPLST